MPKRQPRLTRLDLSQEILSYDCAWAATMLGPQHKPCGREFFDGRFVSASITQWRTIHPNPACMNDPILPVDTTHCVAFVLFRDNECHCFWLDLSSTTPQRTSSFCVLQPCDDRIGPLNWTGLFDGWGKKRNYLSPSHVLSFSLLHCVNGGSVSTVPCVPQTMQNYSRETFQRTARFAFVPSEEEKVEPSASPLIQVQNVSFSSSFSLRVSSDDLPYVIDETIQGEVAVDWLLHPSGTFLLLSRSLKKITPLHEKFSMSSNEHVRSRSRDPLFLECGSRYAWSLRLFH